MKSDTPTPERFLSRWSRLKREAVADPATPPAEAPAANAADSAARLPIAPGASTSTSAPAVATVAGARPAAAADAEPLLPPIDSLTFESDFSQFFQPRVPEALRRAAVKKLFADPHFNIMDGLDTYIDDYSKPDPLPEGWLEKMTHARDLIDHPSNRRAAEEAAAAAAADDARAAAGDGATATGGTASPAATAATDPDQVERGDELSETPIVSTDGADTGKTPTRTNVPSDAIADQPAIDPPTTAILPVTAIHSERPLSNGS